MDRATLIFVAVHLLAAWPWWWTRRGVTALCEVIKNVGNQGATYENVLLLRKNQLAFWWVRLPLSIAYRSGKHMLMANGALVEMKPTTCGRQRIVASIAYR